jgi:hypothetical protein
MPNATPNMADPALKGNADMPIDPQMRDVAEAIDAIRPHLAGRPPEIQGAVLAELLATYLAGYQGNAAEALREELLAHHVATVRELIPVIEAEMTPRECCRRFAMGLTFCDDCPATIDNREVSAAH